MTGQSCDKTNGEVVNCQVPNCKATNKRNAETSSCKASKFLQRGNTEICYLADIDITSRRLTYIDITFLLKPSHNRSFAF